MTLYRKEIIEHWKFPRHRGAIQEPDSQGEAMNSLCGDEITVFLKLDPKKEWIEKALFSGEGCALMSASADILCEHLAGKGLAEVSKLRAEDILEMFGEAPTPSRLKCVLLPLQAFVSGLAAL